MATVTAWSKPGAWALDSEENEAIEAAEREHQHQLLLQHQQQPLSDFPSLATAVSSKPSKKKKPQAFSLSELTTGKQVTHGSARTTRSSDTAKCLTTDELFILPTGPRERSAEELERGSSGRLGGGFRGYGSGREDGSGGFGSRRENSDRVPDAPSRADENDDWGAGKKSNFGFERRERDRGFFDSHQQSRADDSDNWGSNKSVVTSDNRKSGGGGFRSGFEMFSKEGAGNGTGAVSDSWGRRGSEGANGAGSDSWGKKGSEGANGAGSDSWGRRGSEGANGAGSDSWGRKGGDEVSGGGRPKLVLQLRSLSVGNGELQQGGGRSKDSNPFGEARPREEVLAEKGQDWKKIEEKLDAVKIKEWGSGSGLERSDGSGSFSKRSFGSGNGRADLTDERPERSWKKNEYSDTNPARSEKADGEAAEVPV